MKGIGSYGTYAEIVRALEARKISFDDAKAAIQTIQISDGDDKEVFISLYQNFTTPRAARMFVWVLSKIDITVGYTRSLAVLAALKALTNDQHGLAIYEHEEDYCRIECDYVGIIRVDHERWPELDVYLGGIGFSTPIDELPAHIKDITHYLEWGDGDEGEGV